MSTPAATAARTASEPEWKNVPSPRFCTRCCALDERGHADPLGALVAHRRQPGDVADPLRLHQRDHRVATDAAADERALGHPRRQVVRAAAAVERRAVDGQRDLRRLAARRERAQAVVAEAGREAAPQRLEQAVGVEHPGARHEQAAGLVVATDDARALVGVVHRALHEQFQRRVLLLDDEDLGEAVGEVADLLLVDGHRHQEVEQADAGGAQGVIVARGRAGRAPRAARGRCGRWRRCRSSRCSVDTVTRLRRLATP